MEEIKKGIPKDGGYIFAMAETDPIEILVIIPRESVVSFALFTNNGYDHQLLVHEKILVFFILVKGRRLLGGKTETEEELPAPIRRAYNMFRKKHK